MAMWHNVLVFFALLSGSFAIDVIANLLQDTSNCEESCTQSYAPHTNPMGEDAAACARGCRFYSISSFTADEVEDKKELIARVTELCKGGCVEAYNETSNSTTACKSGCDQQSENAAKMQERATIAEEGEEEEDGEETVSTHMLVPFMRMQEVISRMIGTMRIIKSTAITYFMSDDDRIIVVASEPQVEMEFVDPEDMDNNNNVGDRFYNGGDLRRQLGGGGEDLGVSARDGMPVPSDSDFDAMFTSARVTTLLTVVGVVWLCLLLCYGLTYYSAWTPKQKQMIQSAPLRLPSKAIRPEDLTKLSLDLDDDDFNAPPLPHKIKLDHAII